MKLKFPESWLRFKEDNFKLETSYNESVKFIGDIGSIHVKVMLVFGWILFWINYKFGKFTTNWYT